MVGAVTEEEVKKFPRRMNDSEAREGLAAEELTEVPCGWETTQTGEW